MVDVAPRPIVALISGHQVAPLATALARTALQIAQQHRAAVTAMAPTIAAAGATRAIITHLNEKRYHPREISDV